MVCPKGSIGCTGMCRHNPQVLARQLLGLPSPKISSTKPQWQFIHESTHEWMGCPTQKDLIVYDDVEIFSNCCCQGANVHPSSKTFELNKQNNQMSWNLEKKDNDGRTRKVSMLGDILRNVEIEDNPPENIQLDIDCHSFTWKCNLRDFQMFLTKIGGLPMLGNLLVHILFTFETKELCNSSKFVLSNIDHKWKYRQEKIWFEYNGVKYVFKNGSMSIADKELLIPSIVNNVIDLDQVYQYIWTRVAIYQFCST